MRRSFTVPLTLTLRACTERDLPLLEWFGMFTPHREIIAEAYARQEAGENLMIVADQGGFPVGQVWIDLTRRRARSIGLIWALRVIPCLQNLGIGGRLLAAAEEAIGDHDLAIAEIGVEKDNVAALRLYQRCGYEVVGEEQDEYSYVTPDGARVLVLEELWVLHKPLRGGGALRNA